MLSQAENELLCRVSGGAPMGDLMSRYWLPATLSSDLRAGGAPKAVQLLGNRYVAFRDSTGQVGVLDEACPHRGASLALARNENCALQCLYHGWRLDRTGTVVETPSEPGDSQFKDRIPPTGYPTLEAGGIIWVYLGPAEHQPPFPAFEWLLLPDEQRFILRAVERCNWAQAAEGVIDSAHIMMLHSDAFRPGWADDIARTAAATEVEAAGGTVGDIGDYGFGNKFNTSVSQDIAPKLLVETTPYGFRYAAVRKTPDPDLRYVRTTHFVAPFFGFFPGPKGWGFMQAFVPTDDHTTMFYWVQFRLDGQPIDEETRRAACEASGLVTGVDIDDEGNNRRHAGNGWLQDRAAMERRESFSGVQGFQVEDFAVQESMGPLFDRSREHVGRADMAVIRMRRVLLELVHDLREGQAPATHGGFDLGRIRAGEAVIRADEPWQRVGDWLEPATR